MRTLLLSFLMALLSTSAALPQSSSGTNLMRGTFEVIANGPTMTLNADCSVQTPCITGPDNQPVATYYPSTVSIPSGSVANDTALIYIDALNPSVINVGTQSVALTCVASTTTQATSLCATKTGMTSVPFGSKLLYSWPIVNGSFQPYNVTYDFRNIMPTTSFTFGSGFFTMFVNGVAHVSLVPPPNVAPTVLPTNLATTNTSYNIVADNDGKCLDVNGGAVASPDGTNVQIWGCWGGSNQHFRLVPITASVPAPTTVKSSRLPKIPRTSHSACETGEQAHDQNYSYFCVAKNMWKRSKLEAF